MVLPYSAGSVNRYFASLRLASDDGPGHSGPGRSASGVPHVQKGAALIVYDRTAATVVAATALSLGLFFFCPVASSAAPAAPADAAPNGSLAAPAASTDERAQSAHLISLNENGRTSVVTTRAATVGAFLAERGIALAPDDFLSVPQDRPLTDGMHVVHRSAIAVEIHVGGAFRVVRSAAGTVAGLLAEQHIRLGPSDIVTPGRRSQPSEDEIVRVERLNQWTERVRRPIAPGVERRDDPTMAAGRTETIAQGAPGQRELIVRYVSRDGASPSKTILASRVITPAEPRIIVRGVAAYASLARVAQQGFEGAMHFAGKALHMIATAYTAGCAGCSGITASGMRAGFGIIAVDPSVIPLGTKLFIPGYGRAVAGDIGGAIRGNRVDLGMNSYDEAIRWGKQPVTVYILR